MRVALIGAGPAWPDAVSNGHGTPAQVYAITGLCQQLDFRLRPQTGDCLLARLGAAQLGEGGEDPYLLLRRDLEDGGVAVVLRIEWEGVFTLLANDDAAAEALFQEWLRPAEAEEVQRQWTSDAATMDLYRLWLQTS